MHGHTRQHRHRMRYADCVKRGLTIGSGVVETANKTHVTERLKWSGIRWGLEGGQAVLTFRSLVKSDRFDRAWDKLIDTVDVGGLLTTTGNVRMKHWQRDVDDMSQCEIHTLPKI